jgi:hypothetical protein
MMAAGTTKAHPQPYESKAPGIKAPKQNGDKRGVRRTRGKGMEVVPRMLPTEVWLFHMPITRPRLLRGTPWVRDEDIAQCPSCLAQCSSSRAQWSRSCVMSYLPCGNHLPTTATTAGHPVDYKHTCIPGQGLLVLCKQAKQQRKQATTHKAT